MERPVEVTFGETIRNLYNAIEDTRTYLRGLPSLSIDARWKLFDSLAEKMLEENGLEKDSLEGKRRFRLFHAMLDLAYMQERSPDLG